MPTQEHLYIITASNEDAKEHVRKSIANAIDPAICAAHFSNDVLDEVRRKSTDGNFYAWGARPGKRNEPNWNALQEGDCVFLYQDGNYTYWTRVISQHRNSRFAKTVWVGRYIRVSLITSTVIYWDQRYRDMKAPWTLCHSLGWGDCSEIWFGPDSTVDLRSCLLSRPH